jgi:hypothetical protein
MTSSLRRIAACACAAAAVVLAPAAANAQLPSDESIRVIDTPHFRVHYAPGM